MSRSKQVAIVTGASRGLGRVIAGVLAAQGVDLVIGARHAAALAATGAELMGAGATVLAVAGDVVEDLVRRRLLAAASDLGGLDILVNNASALGPIRPLMEFDVSRFNSIFDVNATAPLALMQL